MKIFTGFITRILNRELEQAKGSVKPASERDLPTPFYSIEPSEMGVGLYKLYYCYYLYTPCGGFIPDKKLLRMQIPSTREAEAIIEHLKQGKVTIPCQ